MTDRGEHARRPGRPARLSQEAVVVAAEGIIDQHGIHALTMRRVASELGSSPMALYRHVRNKDELLTLLLDRLASRIRRPSLPENPRERLATLWRVIHDGMDARPWTVPVLAAGDLMGPSALWLIEDVLASFRAAGLSDSQALAAHRIVWRFTVGTLTVRHARARRDAEADQPPAVVGTDQPPAPTWINHQRAAGHEVDSYDRDVAALLAGLLD